MYPFTIRLKDRTLGESKVRSLRLKVLPGSKVTGLALAVEVQKTSEPVSVDEAQAKPDPELRNERVLWLGELQHRGEAIRKALEQRGNYRRRRRSANLRYRAPRFNNRRKPAGWLAPSIRHRVESTTNFTAKLRKLAPVAGLSVQTAKFDTQMMQALAETGEKLHYVHGHGDLYGYEFREYLLEKWGRKCAYCGKENVPLQIDHIVPKAAGGSDRASNLTLACGRCNQAKGSLPVQEFLKNKPVVLKKILAVARVPLRDAAAVNITRWALFRGLKETGLSLEIATGGRTKWNRKRFGLPKTKALDAACVGKLEGLTGYGMPVLTIKCMGRGQYRRTLVDKYGFNRGNLMRKKSVNGFRTGDIVRAVVPKGKSRGTHTGRIAVRATGSFDLTTKIEQYAVSYRNCSLIQRADGYAYALADAVGL
jgi:5-methylcytosine-specific restriction endonuclease McrA